MKLHFIEPTAALACAAWFSAGAFADVASNSDSFRAAQTPAEQTQDHTRRVNALDVLEEMFRHPMGAAAPEGDAPDVLIRMAQNGSDDASRVCCHANGVYKKKRENRCRNAGGHVHPDRHCSGP